MSAATCRRQYRPGMTPAELRLAVEGATALAGSRDAKSARAGRCRLRVLRELEAGRDEPAGAR